MSRALLLQPEQGDSDSDRGHGREGTGLVLLCPCSSGCPRRAEQPRARSRGGGFVSRGGFGSRGLCPRLRPVLALPAVMLIEELQCPGRLKTLKRLKGKRLSRLQPLPGTLRLLGLLQLDENHRVSKAATACLARASGCGTLRARVRAGTKGGHWGARGQPGVQGAGDSRGTPRSFPGNGTSFLALF